MRPGSLRLRKECPYNARNGQQGSSVWRFVAWGYCMAPPEVGSEVPVILNGRITRYNSDNTLNVKLRPGPGRPHKIPFHKVVDTLPREMPPIANDSVKAVIPQLEPLPQLQPLPPLSPIACEPAHAEPCEPTSKRRSVLSWATFAAVGGTIALGIIHGIGSKMVEEIWPHIKVLFHF